MSWKLIDQFATRPELDLLPHEAHVFFYMLHRAEHDGTAIYPSISTIAIACRLGERQVQKILHVLEEKGYLIRVNSGRGRNNLPMWNTPLDQAGAITPRPMAAATGQQDRRGQKPRKPHLVPVPDEPFLDVDQAPTTGKEIAAYHQSVEEYQAGYAPRQLRVLPQPGVKVDEIPPLSEVVQVQMDVFRATVEAQIKTKRAELAEKQQRIVFLKMKIAEKTADEKPGGILLTFKRSAEEAVAQLMADLAELEELVQPQQTQRREVL